MNLIKCSLFYKNMFKINVRCVSPETLEKLLADRETAIVTFLRTFDLFHSSFQILSTDPR